MAEKTETKSNTKQKYNDKDMKNVYGTIHYTGNLRQCKNDSYMVSFVLGKDKDHEIWVDSFDKDQDKQKKLLAWLKTQQSNNANVHAFGHYSNQYHNIVEVKIDNQKPKDNNKKESNK